MTDTLQILNHIFYIAVIITVAAAVGNVFIKLCNNVIIPAYIDKKYPKKKNMHGKKKKNMPKRPELKKLPCFETTDFTINSKKVYYILLGVTVLIGIGIRLWKFGDVPGGFNQDGAMAAVDGKALADYATDRFGTFMPAHLYAWGYGQMSSLLSYLIALFVKIGGLNTFTARLPQLIASVGGGVFFYLFIKDIFGRGAGLIAALTAALNPWHFLQSRWALDCNLLPHFFMAGLYFLNKGITKKMIYTYISMIFFALCMYCYGITIYTIPLFLAAAAIYYLVKKKLTWKNVLISLVVYLAIAWPFILTMAVNYLKYDTIELPFVTIQYFSESVRSGDILLFSDNKAEQLSANIKSLMNTTLFQKKDLPWNDIEGFGTMFLFTMPFFFAGIVEFIRTKTDGAKGIVLFALLSGVWAGLMTNNVNINRINIIYYGIMMFIVLGVLLTIKELKLTKWTNLTMMAISGIMLVSTYFGTYADEIKVYFYDGFGQALEEAENSGAEKIYVTADAQGEGYWNVSEILTMFYDKTDAKYFQGETNTNNGRELLPYKERFTYESMDKSVVNGAADENAAFVIMNSDTKYFDTDKYKITSYGNFCAVTEK